MRKLLRVGEKGKTKLEPEERSMSTEVTYFPYFPFDEAPEKGYF